MLEGQRFFLCQYLIYSCIDLLHEPNLCGNTSVCYKKTMLNIDWHGILPFLNFDEFFHDS